MEKTMTGKNNKKDIWGRTMWKHLSKWAKVAQIFVPRVNAHQSVTSEEFSNQVERMTHSVDNQPLFPAMPVIAQWTHEPNGHGGRDRGYVWAQQHDSPSLTWPHLLVNDRSATNNHGTTPG